MKLIVIRHGQSHVNVSDLKTIDTMDSILTELGKQQAALLRDWLIAEKRTADVLYTSTMRRTRETAAYVSEALGLEPIPDDRIREIGNTHRDGTPVEETALPRAFRFGSQAPFHPIATDLNNAESWLHFRIRIGDFLHDLTEKHFGKTVYVVAHGGVMAAMFDVVFNIGSYSSCEVYTDNTAWSQFEFRQVPDRVNWLLLGHNRVDHLHGTDLHSSTLLKGV